MHKLLTSCLLLAASLVFGPAGWAVVSPAPGPATSRRLPLPRRQRVVINDTLTLLFSQPYGRFTVDGRPTLLWQQAVLHGRRGYRQDLDDDLLDLYATESVVVPHRPDVLLVALWRRPSPPALGGGQPPNLDGQDFVYITWDVRYRTWTTYLDADLEELPYREYRDFLRDPDTQVKAYHLLPYWLAQERARARRTHRLPPPARLAAYLALSGRVAPAYQPLLTRLLRACATCPMPAATARRVALARAR